ncbi:hypothetical protein [Xanthobacter oligotrophicus]|uniref:hypothetical protein n=1 Tax=Xanthobacter oligotrophicus TaxID=2607286 RepID=UPI0011F3C157|nr:hypothetical protein [Xanthobacter oligotrophicus]MCG5238019.1 hypothetical protein [Xanthobacter oligotrophicus]
MKTRTLIAAAVLLSTAGLGVVLAATQADHLSHHFRTHHDGAEASAADRPIRFAQEDHERGRGDRHNGRRHHAEDDDDDDEDEGGRRGAIPQAGPADPGAPVPDNGLFNGKARPKVEVQ